MSMNKMVSDRSGSVALIFVFVLLALVVGVGFVMDLVMIERDRTRGQDSLDAAVLAAAISYQKDRDKKKAELAAQEMFDSGFDKAYKVGLAIEFDATGVHGKLDSFSDLAFPEIAGVSKSKWSVSSSAAFGAAPKNEFALAIDISSSMEAGGHMQALIDALEDFSGEVFKNSPAGDVSVTLVPYANAVTFPPEYSKWLDPVAGYSKSPAFVGCFFDEDTADQASLSLSRVGRYVATPDLVLVTKSGTVNDFCPDDETTLSLFVQDEKSLNSNISKLKSYQGTDTAEAMSWAWRSLSPDWKKEFDKDPNFPLPYASLNAKKIILFTDGMPYERPWEDRKVKGNEKDALRLKELDDFKRVCDAIEKDGRVEVSVIGYGDKMTMSEESILKNCVTSGGQYYDGDKNNISSIFLDIAKSSGQIYLTQ